MAIKTMSLKAADSAGIARDAKAQLADFSPRVMLFFASDIYDATAPAAELQKAFPGCDIIGSTSHSEFCGRTFSEGTVSLMAIDAQSVSDCCIKVVTGVKAHPDFAPTVEEIHEYFGGSDEIFDYFERYVGLVLFESSGGAEEYCMDRLGTATDILFVGGTSSTFQSGASRVYAGGQAYEDAMVLAVLKTVKGYDVVKTQSAQVYSDRGFTVTKSDVENRIMYELDHRPVAQVYAETLGVPIEKIADYFASNPLGVLADGQIFVRTFKAVTADGISLYCGIPEGSEIHLLKIGDIVKDTKRDMERVIKYEPAGVINFNCLYRTFEIQKGNIVQQYCDVFGKYPNIGFSTSGEAFLGHINETSTVLVIK